MAGWIFHLRTAERILTGLPEKPSSETELIHWYMGNLAPDCGVPVGFAEYVPPKDITHFKDGKYICPQTFARQYLQGGMPTGSGTGSASDTTPIFPRMFSGYCMC